MSSYEKLKNDELKKLLSERNLATTGKKADFVARLESHDAQSSTKESQPTPAEKPEPAKSTTTAPVSSTNDKSKSDQEPVTAPTKTTEPAKQEQPPQPSQPLPQETGEEAAKLAQRAARFGISKDEEEERRKARAARFGTQHAPQVEKALTEPKKASAPKGKQQAKATSAAADTAASSHSVKEAPEKRKVSVLDDPVEAEKARKRALKYSTAAPATKGPSDDALTQAPSEGIKSTS